MQFVWTPLTFSLLIYLLALLTLLEVQSCYQASTFFFIIHSLQQSYPAINGITWNLNLNRAARAHCVGNLLSCFYILKNLDRSTCPGSSEFAHNDCNGTTYGDRNAKFYDQWSGEIQWEYNGLGSSITANAWPFWAVA